MAAVPWTLLDFKVFHENRQAFFGREKSAKFMSKASQPASIPSAREIYQNSRPRFTCADLEIQKAFLWFLLSPCQARTAPLQRSFVSCDNMLQFVVVLNFAFDVLFCKGKYLFTIVDQFFFL